MKKHAFTKILDNNNQWSKSLLEAKETKVLLSPQMVTRSGQAARIETGPGPTLTQQYLRRNGGKPIRSERINDHGITVVEFIDKPERSEIGTEEGDYMTINCIPVIKPDSRLRLKFDEEIYTSAVQNQLMRNAETKPSVSVSTTIEMKLEQSVCFVMPKPNTPSENRVIVTLIHAVLNTSGLGPIQDLHPIQEKTKKLEENK